MRKGLPEVAEDEAVGVGAVAECVRYPHLQRRGLFQATLRDIAPRMARMPERRPAGPACEEIHRPQAQHPPLPAMALEPGGAAIDPDLVHRLFDGTLADAGVQ